MKHLLAVKRLFALLSALSLVACLDVSGPGPSNPLNETFAASLGIGDLSDTNVWKQTGNGTFYRDEVVGTGPTLLLLTESDSIFVDYTGWLKDGTEFDSATDAGLRPSGIISGFVDGMVNMRVGGTRLIVVPSNLGFGKARTGPIEPNSTLIFRIKLNTFTGA
jgi:hypothetical protein